MSWQAVAWAQKSKVGNSNRKFILVVMANYANDNGDSIFPSVPTICETTELEDRCVQGHLKALVAQGLLIVTAEPKGKPKVYRMPIDQTPAEFAPPQNLRPPVSRQEPPQVSTLTPAEFAPNPSINLKEPSVCGNKRFCKPTVAQVQEYFKKLGAEDYLEFGEAWHDRQVGNGWKTKTGSMADWQACCRTAKRFAVKGDYWQQRVVALPEPVEGVDYKRKPNFEGDPCGVRWNLKDEDGAFNQKNWQKSKREELEGAA